MTGTDRVTPPPEAVGFSFFNKKSFSNKVRFIKNIFIF
jgi:hypothetical protein